MKFTIALITAFAVAEAQHFKSGAVTGFEKFTYGKFLTRMRAPNKKGTVSSFFTYWNGPNFYPGGWNELDIEIVPSVAKNPLSMNAIYGDGIDKHESHQYSHGFNPKDEWHTYQMEWTPDGISWTIDGVEVRHMTPDHPAVHNMNKEQSLRMNFWTPTFHSWGQGLDAKDMPWFLLYDYVEVYTYNHLTNEFELHWRDDFDTFDEKRWHKASGGFQANSSVFHPDNVSVKAGHLVLKMEPANKTTQKEQKEDAIKGEAKKETAKKPKKSAEPSPSQHRQRAHHLSRDHARSAKATDDKKFWIGGKPPAESKKDEIPAQAEEKLNEYFDSETDSDADWNEYQAYVHGRHGGLHHVGHEDYGVVESAPVVQVAEDKYAYKQWKQERKA